MAAMMTASSEIVSMLLEYGANVDSVDAMGNDSFMFASCMGNSTNLQTWIESVKDWNLNRQNIVLGGCALGLAVYVYVRARSARLSRCITYEQRSNSTQHLKKQHSLKHQHPGTQVRRREQT